MTAPRRRPAGRLPARVYWFRRGLVLATVLALVFAVAHLLSGGGDRTAPTAARQSGVKTTPTPAGGPLGPVAVSTSPGSGPTGTAPTVGLAQPTGSCAIDEVTVTPVAATAKAGGPISLTLQLTGVEPACTFAVSANSLVAKVTAGTKRVWSSQDCAKSVPSSSVVVRSGTPATVQVTWSGRYSDSLCSRSTDWAMPGTYQVEAAAIGSEPSDATLKLTAPPTPIVTKTIYPKQKIITPGKAGTTKSPTKGKSTTPDTGRRGTD